jgi:uncharacterized membrane protein YhaH (DUF805 family)
MKMTFVDAVKSGLRNYSNFKGTASRTEFWYFYLFTVLLNMVTGTVDNLIAPSVDLTGSMMASAGPLYMITNIALILPNLTLAVRRFHDAGLSGKWLGLWVLPVIAFFVTGGVAFAGASKLTATSTDAEVLAYLSVFIPTLLIAAAVGVFQLVINLKATKTAAQGNKYASQQEAETSASE